jgi:hypothetical protein
MWLWCLFGWDHVALGYKVQTTQVYITLNDRIDTIMPQISRIKSLLLLTTLVWMAQGHTVERTVEGTAESVPEWASALPDGSNLPLIEAPDTQGVLQTNDTLMGENGLLLQFNRSSDW